MFILLKILFGDAASITLWHQRELQVMYSLAGCLTDMKDFRLAVTVYKEILARDPDNACFTYSTMARLCLQVSNLPMCSCRLKFTFTGMTFVYR